MTWLDKGLRLESCTYCLAARLTLGLIWPDLIRDYDSGKNFSIRKSTFEGLIWPDLIRDYDAVSMKPHLRPKYPFDMTWLDKGLRQTACRTSWVYCAERFDMTWLDKGLRPRFFSAALRAALWDRFDMTWLDKGLRLRAGTSQECSAA